MTACTAHAIQSEEVTRLCKESPCTSSGVSVLHLSMVYDQHPRRPLTPEKLPSDRKSVID
jgi:hypothetical protein